MGGGKLQKNNHSEIFGDYGRIKSAEATQVNFNNFKERKHSAYASEKLNEKNFKKKKRSLKGSKSKSKYSRSISKKNESCLSTTEKVQPKT